MAAKKGIVDKIEDAVEKVYQVVRGTLRHNGVKVTKGVGFVFDVAEDAMKLLKNGVIVEFDGKAELSLPGGRPSSFDLRKVNVSIAPDAGTTTPAVSAVSALQTALNARHGAKLAVDNVWGPLTAAAVESALGVRLPAEPAPTAKALAGLLDKLS